MTTPKKQLHRPNLWAGGGDGERARLQRGDHILLSWMNPPAMMGDEMRSFNCAITLGSSPGRISTKSGLLSAICCSKLLSERSRA